MLGYLFLTIIFLLLNVFTAGIPSIVFCMLLEAQGIGLYVYGLTFAILSFISLAYFIFTSIECFDDLFREIGIGIIIVLTIIAFFMPIHSMSYNLIYQNIILRILMINLIPSLILNVISIFVAEDDESIFHRIFAPFIVIVGLLYISFCIASTSMFVANVWFSDISKGIQNGFIYDNPLYDEIREKNKVKNEYKFLKSQFKKAYSEYEITCNIQEKECLDEIHKNVIKNSRIIEYGYSVSRSSYTNPDIRYLRILDKKTNHYSHYKINYKEFSFEKSTFDEFKAQTTK